MEDLIDREHLDRLPPGVLRVLSNGKRQYATEFKAELVRQCLVPGTSVAATGMAHGVNANLLRRWIVLHGEQGRGVAQTPALLAVTLRAPPPVSASSVPRACVQPQIIEIDIHGVQVRLHGQVDPQRLGVVLDVLAQRA